MDKIKEKVSNWLSSFKDHIQSFNVIAQEKNFVYFSKFTLEAEEFFKIHNFVIKLKYNIMRDLFDQMKYCVYNIISFADKNLSEREKIMTLYSACFLNYFKKFLYDTNHKFEEFYDCNFFNLVKTFNVQIKNMEIFKVLSFCFFNKMKEEIIKLNYESEIKPLKQTYNPKIDLNFSSNNDNNINMENENNIKNTINEEGAKVKNKAINYVVSAKEKIVDIIYEIKLRNFLPNIFPNEEINSINNTFNRLNNISGKMFDHFSKSLKNEKIELNEILENTDINMSLNDAQTTAGLNESFNNSINLNLNQSFNKVNEISNSDNFKNNMDFISNINNKIINSNDINNINNFNMNSKNNNINKINFINVDNKLQNQNNINEIKMSKEGFNNINNNNQNNNYNQSKFIFKPYNVVLNPLQNKNNMYSHRLIDELIKNKIDDKTMEIIINVAKKIDEKYLDYILNNSPKPILILDYFSCYVASFTPKMLQDIDPENAQSLGNVNIKFLILAKELYNTAMELFCSIYDLTSTNINRFLDLAKNCGIHAQYTQGLYKLFKDYSVFLLEENAFKNLRKTVEKFIEMERFNWEKVINSQTSNISSF